MREQGLAKELLDLARRLNVLGDQLMAQRNGHPAVPRLEHSSRLDEATQSLITELTRVVLRLQRDVDDLRRSELAQRPGLQAPDVAPANLSAQTIQRSGMDIEVASNARGLVTSSALASPDSRGAHGVHFSRSHEHTVAAIVDMVVDALAQGRTAVVVATGLHRRWIEAELQQRCVPFEGDACRLIDADTTLSSLLVDGEPDRDRFWSIIGALLTDVCAENPGGVSVYGEMVGILWSKGQAVAVMRLEEFWNELQRDLPFSLLCGYLIDGSPDSPNLDPIRHTHTYVA